MKEDFNEYMTYYKGLPLKEKQGIIIDQLKMLEILTNKMCSEIGVSSERIFNTENSSEEDFNDTVITLINSIQNSICDFNLKLKEINDNIE